MLEYRPSTKLRTTIFCLIIISCIIGGLFLWNINIPFVGLHEGNNLWHTQCAKNFLKHGIIATRGVPYLDLNLNKPYLNHPNLLPILLAVFYRILGFGNLTGRLLPILFSISTIFIIFALVKSLWTERLALYSFFLTSFLPIYIIFGKMINYEALVLFSSILTLYLYQLWFQNEQKKTWNAFVVSACFSLMIDWPAYFMLGLLFLTTLIFKRDYKCSFIIALLAIVVFSSFVLYVYMIKGSISSLTDAYLNRTGGLGGATIPPLAWSILLILRGFIYFTPAILLFSILGLYSFVARATKIGIQELSLCILFLFGLLNVTIFYQAAWIHNYWLYYFIPFFSITAAMGISRIETFGKITTLLSLTFFLLCSLSVVFTVKHFERNNCQLYDMLAKVIQSERLESTNKLAVVASRQFEWYLLPVYHNIDVTLVNDVDRFLELLDNRTTSFLIRIYDPFVTKRHLSILTNYLKDNFHFTVYNSSRFRILVFYLKEARSLSDTEPESSRRFDMNRGGQPKDFVGRIVLPIYSRVLTWIGAPEI